jgi:hypothetical protein
MITAGTYLARAVLRAWGAHERQADGVEMPKLDIRFTISEPPSFEGEQIEKTLYFPPDSEKACDISWKAVRACGWDGVDKFELAGFGDVDVELVVKDREFNGNTYTEVQWINKPGQGRANFDAPAPDGHEARMRALLGAPAPRQQQRQPARQAPAARSPAQATGTGTDDIPF